MSITKYTSLTVFAAATLLAALLLLTAGEAKTQTQCRNIGTQTDIDQVVNTDPVKVATRFCLSAGTHYASETVRLGNRDVLIGPKGEIEKAGAADFATKQAAKIRPAPGVELVQVIKMYGDSTLAWVNEAGAVGAFRREDPSRECLQPYAVNGACPKPGTGIGVNMGDATSGAVVRYSRVGGNAAVGIAGARGRLIANRLVGNGYDQRYVGYTASHIKAVTELEVTQNYITGGLGMGIWCDAGCKNDSAMRQGLWIHENTVAGTPKWGIRYESSPDDLLNGIHKVNPTALIEDNGLHGSAQGGLSVFDAQNATVRRNTFGPATLVGVSYPQNAKALHIFDSDRPERTDLYNVRAINNTLNGEAVTGCELPDDVVYCRGNH